MGQRWGECCYYLKNDGMSSGIASRTPHPTHSNAVNWCCASSCGLDSVSMCHITHPNDQMSHFSLILCRWSGTMSSGAANCGVPAWVVMSPFLCNAAEPKSHSLMWLSREISMFPDLISRCTTGGTHSWCKYARASAMSRAFTRHLYIYIQNRYILYRYIYIY